MMRRFRIDRFLGAALAATALLSTASAARAQTATTSADAGSRVYATNCAACHQASGMGLAGAVPPLAGHVPDLLKPADGRTYVEKVLLFGLEGAISVNGADYAGAMPSWQALSDDEVAAVLHYVSGAWDNGKSLPAGFRPFTADEIKALRT